MTLAWHNATAEHRQHLSTFACTLPDHCEFDEDMGVISHDYPWEMVVQNFFHEVRPPAYPPEFLYLGFEDGSLAAAIYMRVRELDRFCFIQAVGVAHRFSGNGLAAEALAQVAHVMARYGITSDYVVEAKVDPHNVSAQSAFAKSGYEHTGDSSGWEMWTKRF